MAKPTPELRASQRRSEAERPRRAWSRAAEHLARVPFIRNIVVLLSGAGASVALILLTTPILSRIYGPELFGILAVFTSVLSVLLTCASLCYEMAIPLAEDDATALDALALSFWILLGMTLIVCAAVFFFSERFAAVLNCRPLLPYMWLLPVGFLGGGAYQILSYWALRKEAFGQIATTRLSQGVAMVFTQVCLGLISQSAIGLLFGDVLGRATGVGVLSRYAARSWKPQSQTADRLRYVAARYAKFPKFSAAANLLTSLSTNIPVLIIARYFGPVVAGLYALTFRVLRMPMALLGQAVGQAFFARAASISRKPHQLSVLTERSAVALLTVGLPIFAFLVLDGPSAFAAVFGERWRASGAYAQLLAPWFLLWLVANPLSSLLTVREWQGRTLWFSGLECGVQALALLAGVWIGSDWICIGLLGSTGFCLCLLILRRLLIAGHTSAWRILKQVSGPAATVVVCCGVASVLIVGTELPFVAFRLLFIFALYVLLVWRFRWLMVPAREEAHAV